MIREAGVDEARAARATLSSVAADLTIRHVTSQSLEVTGQTAVYVQCAAGVPVWGVGIARDPAGAVLKAVLSAVGRASAIITSPLQDVKCS